VALLVTVAYLAQYALYYQLLRSELQISFRELYSSVGPALWGMLGLSVVFMIGEVVGGGSILVFLIKLAFSAVSYLVIYGVASKWRLYKDMRNLSNGYL
jgi:hypothetical protein